MYACLLLAVLSFPFMVFEVFPVGDKSIVLPYVAAFLLAVPVLACLPEAHRRAEEDPALPLLLGWFLVACLSSIWNYLRDPWDDILRKNVTQVVNLLMMLVHYVFFVIALRVLPLERVTRVVRWLVNEATLGAAYSLYQVAAVFYDWPFWDVMRTANLYQHAPPTGWIGLPRAFGTAPEPSFWGAYLALALAFVLGRPVRARDLLRLGLLMAAVVATFSRGAWLTAALLVFLAWMIRVAPKRAMRLLPAVLPLSLALTAGPALVTETTTLPWIDLSAVERISSQKTGLRVFAEHPLLGVGFGSVEFFTERYAFTFPGNRVTETQLPYVHNCFILVLASTGLIGMALFVGFLWRLMWPLSSMTIMDPRSEELRLGALLGCVASFGFWLNTPAYNVSFIWFPFALAAALSRRGGPSSGPTRGEASDP